eukprot:1162051-Pelagomonas_calceolata.AAC.14
MLTVRPSLFCCCLRSGAAWRHDPGGAFGVAGDVPDEGSVLPACNRRGCTRPGYQWCAGAVWDKVARSSQRPGHRWCACDSLGHWRPQEARTSAVYSFFKRPGHRWCAGEGSVLKWCACESLDISGVQRPGHQWCACEGSGRGGEGSALKWCAPESLDISGVQAGRV